MPRRNWSGLFFFFILIEIWDPGLTIREVGRRKIHIGPWEKMVSRPRRKMRGQESWQGEREWSSAAASVQLFSPRFTAMALGTPPLFRGCTWTCFLSFCSLSTSSGTTIYGTVPSLPPGVSWYFSFCSWINWWLPQDGLSGDKKV